MSLRLTWATQQDQLSKSKQTNKPKKKKSVIPSTQEVEFGRIKFKANSGKKLARSYLNYTSRAW
jgi:hypothetical protein